MPLTPENPNWQLVTTLSGYDTPLNNPWTGQGNGVNIILQNMSATSNGTDLIIEVYVHE